MNKDTIIEIIGVNKKFEDNDSYSVENFYFEV